MKFSARYLPGLFLCALLATGLAGAETFHFDSSETPGISLRSQGTDGVELHFGMDEFSIKPFELNGEMVDKIMLTGVLLPNNEGAPDLPSLSRWVAMPEGASATFEVVSMKTQVFHDIDVSPAPTFPIESSDLPTVYERDPAIYGRDAYYPEQPVMMSEQRQIRGVDAVIVGITPFRYNPITRELIVYSDIDVRVDFHGGTGHFGEDPLRNRYWEPILENHLLNYSSLPEIDFDIPREDRDGYEYIIITPDNPEFIPWADTLKTWRELQGISTGIFTTTDIGGTSSTVIENFLNDAYDNWDPRPVAFLLLGDFPNSGDRDDGITSPTWSGYCVSDNIYADRDGDDLPDMIHGRITARDGGELATMIGKMLSYERAPYTDPDFYDHPVIAGGWQDDRWFILCTETVWGHQTHVLGKNAIREYAIGSGSPGTFWSTNQNTYMIVDYFGPDGLGYIPETSAHLTDWGGNATRLNADLNAGAYMVMHRDHGSVGGWDEPYYRNANVEQLTNEMYPFVFSINCLTGKYNDSSECFTEAFHRMGYGALGLIAASEVSYSFVNDTFIWGLCDEMWPEFMPDRGRATGPGDLRPGFGMVSGKIFLEGSEWPYNPQHKVYTHHLFHTHGDAFIQMYSEVPQELTVIHDGVCFVDVGVFTIQADEGAIVALTVDGDIIGVAEGTGMPMDMMITPQGEPGDLRITVTKANYFRHDEIVPIVPPEGPYLTLGARTIDDDRRDDSDGNADGDCDAGEAIEVIQNLRNVGNETATNVRATLVCEDEFCTVVDDYEDYGDVAPDTEIPCLEDFDIAIHADCPDGRRIGFTLVVESDNRMAWEKAFSLDVEAPIMSIDGYLIDDTAGGDGDGRLEPGETILLSAVVANTGSEDASTVTANLSAYHPYVTVHQGVATTEIVAAGGQSTLSPPFEIEVDASYPDPGMLFANIVLTADWDQAAEGEIQVPVGGFFDNMEEGVGNWTHYLVTDGFVDQWHQSTTRNYTPEGTWSWKFGDTGAANYADLADGALETEAMTLRERSFLRFRHWMDAEVSSMHAGYCYDGGMVEMSINDGPWEQIFPVGGYTHMIRPGGTPGPWPADTEVYSGSIDWAEAVFEIHDQIGQAKFRFRFGSDGAVNEEGWYIDDVEFSGYDTVDPADVDVVSVRLRPAIDQNRPNPFGPATTIAFQAPAGGDVLLRVFDPAGRVVRTLVDGSVDGGSHIASWDGRNDEGGLVGSGVYFYRFETDGVTETRKMILTR